MRRFALVLLAIVSYCSCVTSDMESSAPGLISVIKCGLAEQPLKCARTKIGRLLDIWEHKINRDLDQWGEEADRELKSSGRQLTSDPPSVMGHKLMMAIDELATILQKSLYRSQARKKAQEAYEKTKNKKKNTEVVRVQQNLEQNTLNKEGTLIQGLWVDQELIGPPKTRIKRENIQQKQVIDVEDARGHKKKRKKAILKLLLLGAVLKAKLGLLLQLFSAHLQVKFFAIALAGLALNIARFWFDLKKGHTPQKVIYYEHAQHQHHYDHEEDHGWGGYWSRSIDEKPFEKKQDETVAANNPSEDFNYGGWFGRSQTSHRRRRKR